MRATALWVVFSLCVVLYQVNAIPVASHKSQKAAEVKEQDKSIGIKQEEKEQEKETEDDKKEDEEEEPEDESDSSGDTSEEEPESENDSSASGISDSKKGEHKRDTEETGEEADASPDKRSKAVAVKRQCGCCGGGCCGGGGGGGCCGGGGGGHGGSWGVHDLCHHSQGDGWCGAGCMCGNCCGGFGCPQTNHGCNGGCCPSVTFPCQFGACVNNPCCECCREPAPPGKCKWPCLWPCCCECTPPKFKFKPLKPKPVCNCPHHGCCGGHRRSGLPTKRQFVSPFAPAFAPAFAPLYGQELYGHPYGLLPHEFAPLPPPYLYGPPFPYF